MSNKLFSFIFLISVFLLTNSCKKASFTPIQVTYKVKIAAGNKVRIEYNSDYFFETGTLKSVDFIGTGGTWYANHIAEEQEDYYIKVDYIDSTNFEDNFKVQVYFNDTTQAASFIADSIVPQVILQGRVGG